MGYCFAVTLSCYFVGYSFLYPFFATLFVDSVTVVLSVLFFMSLFLSFGYVHVSHKDPCGNIRFIVFFSSFFTAVFFKFFFDTISLQ